MKTSVWDWCQRRIEWIKEDNQNSGFPARKKTGRKVEMLFYAKPEKPWETF